MNLRERREQERARKIATRIFHERRAGVPTSYPNLDVLCAPDANAPRADVAPLPPVPMTAVAANPPPRNEDK